MKLAILALSLSLSVPALADSIVPIYGTLTDGGVASGTLTIDTSVTPDPSNPATWDFVTGEDLTLSDNGSTYLFDTIQYQAIQTGEYYVDSYDSAGDMLRIGFPLSELASLGTNDPDFCSAGGGCVYTSAFVTNGQPVQFADIGGAPEPSSLILLGTGILGVAGAARRRFVRA